MNNKRVMFYFISFLILISLYVFYVWAAAPTAITLDVDVKNTTSQSGTPSRLNITTGADLNVTCTARMNAVDNADVAIANLTLSHNMNGTFGLNITNGTSVINLYNTSEQNTSLGLLSITFVVGHNGTVSYDSAGAFTGTLIAAEGNYTFGCQAGYNTTNASFTVEHLRNSSGNVTITIDVSKPNFTVSKLNVTDGTNTVDIDLLNATKSGVTSAYLRNTTLTIKATVNEPYLDKVRAYWVTNGSPIPALNGPTNAILNPGNGTLNNEHNPFNSNNNTVLNGSFRFAGSGTEADRIADFAEATILNFLLTANDSAGNIRNFSNGGVGFNITLDGAAPSVTITLSKSRIETQESVDVTCTANDTSPVAYTIKLTKPSKATVTKNPLDGKSKFSALETGEAGTYTVECAAEDKVSFKTTKSLELSAYYAGDETVSVEEEEVKVAEVDLSRKAGEAIPEETVSGIEGETTTFTLDSTTQHSLTFLDITDAEVTLRFESAPVDVTLKIGETKQVDIDKDGKNDVVVTLNSIKEGKADLTIKPSEEVPLVPSEEPTPAPVTEIEKPSRTGIIVLIIVILAVVVAAYFLLKGKKSKKGGVRFTSKDLSSEFNF